MNLAIIIPTFNRKDSLKQLLTIVIADATECKIVVVNDGSTDGTSEMLSEEFAEVYVVEGDGNWWFTKSLNKGCVYAINKLNANVLITLNDDIVPTKNYFTSLLEDFNSYNNQIMGSMSIALNDKSSITFGGIKEYNCLTGSGIPYIKYGTKYDAEIHRSVINSYTLPTRGLIFTKNTFVVLRGFDEKFPQYASDYDFVLRARKIKVKSYISYNAILYEKTDLTGVGSPKITKGFLMFIKNMFFNKYSPTYYPNSIRMIWRHRPKILFPYYSIISVLGLVKSFYKYNK